MSTTPATTDPEAGRKYQYHVVEVGHGGDLGSMWNSIRMPPVEGWP
jgi:hypothetical protein